MALSKPERDLRGRGPGGGSGEQSTIGGLGRFPLHFFRKTANVGGGSQVDKVAVFGYIIAIYSIIRSAVFSRTPAQAYVYAYELDPESIYKNRDNFSELFVRPGWPSQVAVKKLKDVSTE